jgi:glycosyltransferase involved in cell wall biosynthesis
MKVWILQTGEPLEIDNNGLRPMRAINLSKALIDQGHQVTLWSSDFDHFTKLHRFGTEKTIEVSSQLTIRLIKSRGYKSHIGVGRLLDHAQLGWNLKKMLKHETAPDVSFIGYPPIEPAYVMSSWLRKKQVPYMVDVKDAWPQILLRGLPEVMRSLGRVALAPYFYAMKKTLKNALSISSITDPYLNWCNESANRKPSRLDRVTPLTVQKQTFAKEEIQVAEKLLSELGVIEDGRFKLTFIGTLNSAFNFSPIIEAIRFLDIQLIIAGDGPQYEDIKNESKNNKNIILLGWIDTVLANVLMTKSSFMLAPLKDLDDFRMSMPNKFFDAMQNAKPILTSISGYTGDFLKQHKIGIEYSSEDLENLKKILEKISNDPNLVLQMGNRAREVYETFFQFNEVYGNLVRDLENLASMKYHDNV